MSYGTKHQTVNGVKLMGSNLYGTCATATSTAAKMVTLDGFDVLVTGVTIHVKFTYANYASGRTLTVGSTSAVGIRCNGSSYVYWEAGAVISFTYDGTYWQMNDFYDTDSDANTKYSLSGSGATVTLTGTDGTSSSYTVDTSAGIPSYSLSRSGRTVTLTKDGVAVQSVTVPTIVSKMIERTCEIAAGNTYTHQWTPDTISGYHPIGLVGYELSGSYSDQVNVFSAYFDGESKAYMQMRNNYSAKVSLTVHLRFIYAPD